MSLADSEWLSSAQASELLGVHQTTLRRWADAGEVPCFRTPGGHRRFRAADLAAWLEGRQAATLARETSALLHDVIGFTQREMAEQQVSTAAWHAAFGQQDERQHMRQAGRRLLGLAIQYVCRTGDRERALQEGRRIGSFYGQQCVQRGVSLVDAVRAFTFFRESLLSAARPGLTTPSQVDAQEVHAHRQLRRYLDEVMYACLDSYEAACRLAHAASSPQTRSRANAAAKELPCA